jgi:hypothetical protein
MVLAVFGTEEIFIRAQTQAAEIFK